MSLENVKLLYAYAPGNKKVTIPLIRAGEYDTADIISRLKKAGIPEEEFPYIIFSAVELPSQENLRTRFPTDLVETPPPFPNPGGPNLSPPLESAFKEITSVKVTDSWSQLTGRSYCMERADGKGYVSMLQLQKSSFENSDDYSIIHDGRLELCVGLRWHLNTLQFISGGASWNNVVKSKHGMSQTTSYSISASVGYSGAGVSASLSATFGQTFNVSSETEVTTTVDVQPIAKVSQTAVMWDLRRYFAVKVDGVLRDKSNPFTVVFLDKNGKHQLNDTWTGQYDTISPQPTLKIWKYPEN